MVKTTTHPAAEGQDEVQREAKLPAPVRRAQEGLVQQIKTPSNAQGVGWKPTQAHGDPSDHSMRQK